MEGGRSGWPIDKELILDEVEVCLSCCADGLGRRSLDGGGGSGGGAPAPAAPVESFELDANDEALLRTTLLLTPHETPRAWSWGGRCRSSDGGGGGPVGAFRGSSAPSTLADKDED